MIYYTGDIHGEPHRIVDFCKKNCPTAEDTIIILGDVGANYYGDYRDNFCKRFLGSLSATILCVHGNHEMRPSSISTYKAKEWNNGTVWYEDEYPNLLFAKDGEIYSIEGIRHMAIGGAYSVDKYWRIAHGQGWWEDEQPSDEIKQRVESQLASSEVDVILSHTCPFKYEPREMFLDFIDQSKVDDSTEHWLDTIEENTDYQAWYCGHWHTDKRIDKMHFLFKSFEESYILSERDYQDNEQDCQTYLL